VIQSGKCQKISDMTLLVSLSISHASLAIH